MSNSSTGAVRARTPAERRRAFFYAEAQAASYDVAADLNTPLFSLLQRTLFDLVANHLELVAGGRDQPFVVLDIGSGTGAESLPILKAYPNSRIVAFDLCEPMHETFRAKAVDELGEDAVARRCLFVTGDIAEPAGSPDALLSHIGKWGGSSRYDIVISSLALHHLTTPEKRLVTGRVAEVLAPGGLYLNADIFSYASPTMAKAANDFGIEWIRTNFSNPPADLKPLKDALGDHAGPMGDAWIDHYINFNLPDPVDSLCDASGSSPSGDQAQMLVEAGFAEVAVPFRFWEIGILWALR